MINGYVIGVSPNKPALRKFIPAQNSIIHLTCHQVSLLKIKYDEIWLDESILVNRVILCVQIVSSKEEISPQKKLFKSLFIKDSTGCIFRGIQLFQGNQAWEIIQKLIKQKKYVKICLEAKCSGLYRFEIKFNINRICEIENFNEIQLHMSQIIRDYIQAKSKA